MIRVDQRNILRNRGFALGGAALALVLLAGCTSQKTGLVANSRVTQHGYIISPLALEQVPVGSSREQVLIALGTPSTTAQFSNEVFYYFSQTKSRPVNFMPSKVVEQEVLAVYFDKGNKVSRIARYGLKDGQIFDFVTRTTSTGGQDQSFLQSVFTTNNLKPKLPGT